MNVKVFRTLVYLHLNVFRVCNLIETSVLFADDSRNSFKVLKNTKLQRYAQFSIFDIARSRKSKWFYIEFR